MAGFQELEHCCSILITVSLKGISTKGNNMAEFIINHPQRLRYLKCHIFYFNPPAHTMTH